MASTATPAAPRQTVFTGPANALYGELDTVFMHLIIFRMHPEATVVVRDEALRLMAAMGETEGVLEYHMAESEDTRKGIVLSEMMAFKDRAAFEEFKKTEAHTAFANFIRNWADWNIADYVIPV